MTRAVTWQLFFENPLAPRITIDQVALGSIGLYDFSKLENLETLTVLTGILCDEPDLVRAAFVSKTKMEMSKLTCFSKCPKLERIIFVIGNGSFTT